MKRSTTDGGPYTSLGSVTGTAATDTTAVNHTTCYYVVSAENGAGEGDDSNQASATPTSPPITESERQFSGIGMTGGNLNLSVGASVVGHTYQLQYSDTLAPGSWQNLGAPVPGTGGPLDFSIPVDTSTTPRRFYRMLIQD